MLFGSIQSKPVYRAKLSAAQLADGINSCRDNAVRLLNDAKLLLAHGRWPSAASIAALAMEEFGKEKVLRNYPVNCSEQELKKFWRSFKDHKEKNEFWILPLALSIYKPKSQIELLNVMTQEFPDHKETLDWLKQLGLYADCVEKGSWLVPSAEIDEFHATKLVELADLMAGTGKRPITTEAQIKEMQVLVLKDDLTVAEAQNFQDVYGHKDVLPII